MATDISDTLPRQRRIGPGLILLLAFGGFLVVLLLTVSWAWLASRRELAAELERLRASGEPASVNDIEAFYEVPPAGRDTTKIWLTAMAPLDMPQFGTDGKDLPFVGEVAEPVSLPGEPWPQLDQAEQFLAKYQRSLEGMHRAARLGGQARYPTNFANGISMLLPHVQQLRAAARLLELEAVVHAHRGRPTAAVDSVEAMFAAARSIEQEPILISQLVRMALDGVARQRIAWLLSSDVLDDDQLARLEAGLAAIDYHPSFRRALLGERVIGLQTFADPSLMGRDYSVLRFAPLPAADQALYLQMLAQSIAAADKRGAARERAIEQVDLHLKKLAGSVGGKLRYPITFLTLPSLEAFAVAISRNEAERDATRMAVAIERFRRVHGSVPSKLEVLVPQLIAVVPIDPFSSRPLVYRPTTSEYLVYSIGSNGVDDGGENDPAKLTDDLVVRVKLQTGNAEVSPD